MRCRSLCLTVLLALLPLVSVAGERLLCDACRKPITGAYSKISKGKAFFNLCPSCLNALRKMSAVTCSVCEKRVSSGYTVFKKGETKIHLCSACTEAASRCTRCKLPVKGKASFCNGCKSQLPACSLCREVITSRYITYDNADKFCGVCQKRARCGLCNRPVGNGKGAEVAGKRVCAGCSGKVKVCGCCGEIVKGSYFVHSFCEGVFCEPCEKGRPHCSVCSRPISEGNLIRMAGKRNVCSGCASTAVIDQDRLRAIYGEAASIIKELLGQSIYHQPRLEMVADIADVRKKAGEGSGSKELGLFKRKNNDYRIYILYGITEALAFETVPHEWTHAWFAENGHPRHPQWVEEGYCQWVASQVLKEKGFDRGLRILQTRKDEYGKGYRYIQAIADAAGEKGVSAVLNYVRRPPPPGKPVRAER